MKTTADLGDFDDVVVDQISFDKDTHSLSPVQIDLSEAENCIEIQVENEPPKYSFGTGCISTEFDVDEMIFAKMQDDAEYEWEYRIGGSGEWIHLGEPDDELFPLLTDAASVTYAARDLENLLDNKDAELVEFRLIYKRENICGGSLEIMISGITITNKSLETRFYTNN